MQGNYTQKIEKINWLVHNLQHLTVARGIYLEKGKQGKN